MYMYVRRTHIVKNYVVHTKFPAFTTLGKGMYSKIKKRLKPGKRKLSLGIEGEKERNSRPSEVIFAKRTRKQPGEQRRRKI